MHIIRGSYRRLGPWVGRVLYVNMVNVDELDRGEADGVSLKCTRLGMP